MFEFHADRKRYFDIQFLNTEQYVLPFIESCFSIRPSMRVLEIGCGEGGVLKAFLKRDCIGTGVEFDELRIANGEKWMAEDIGSGRLTFVAKDIYDTSVESLGGKFDIIILKDVIEHIHDQQKLLVKLHDFLQPEGILFFGFPPWQMPFGGHQQLCQGVLGKVPWFHLLPRKLFKAVLRIGKEPDAVIETLLEIKDTGISIERFERMVTKTNYRISARQHYFLNPIYKWKFNVEPKKQLKWITKIPYFRNFVTTCVYYVITAAPTKKF